MATQLEMARHGTLTREMHQVAPKEHVKPKLLLEGICKGFVVIPANVNHRNLEPIGIGHPLRMKVNANIGTSPVKSTLQKELRKLRLAITAGADTVMDLSLGGNLDDIRKAIIEHSTVPVGSVPIYQALVECGDPASLSLSGYLEVFEKHAKSGIDFATVHAGVTREAIRLLGKRLMPTVSRGGTFMVEWMRRHNKQSFLYDGFDEILAIARKYDVTISLGDGLRPGCIADATDKAQLHELRVLGRLAQRSLEAGVQVMVEGPGHIPLNEVEKNVKLAKRLCGNAPLYLLGPLPTDAAAGHDHIAAAIGGALAGMYGADFLCYVTPSEHIGLPDSDDVVEGITAARIAAHIADVARLIPGAATRDWKMSRARADLDWAAMTKYALDPVKFRRLVKAECAVNPDMHRGCSMCGKFCTEKRKT